MIDVKLDIVLAQPIDHPTKSREFALLSLRFGEEKSRPYFFDCINFSIIF